MTEINFQIDSEDLDSGDWALDEILTNIREEYKTDPLTTEEIMRCLLKHPGLDPKLHLMYLALVCATAMQRLVP